MNKNRNLAFLALALLILSSCSSKLGSLSADYFAVTPNPLETKGGKVMASVSGMFPEKYMKSNAVVTVVPELRYGVGNSRIEKGETTSFQGDRVMGNNQTISYRMGGRYTMNTAFNYTPEMNRSDMYLTFNARVGNKSVKIPAVKVATGVISTSELYKKILKNGYGCIAPDSFERVKAMKQESNIWFLVNKSDLRQSELKGESLKQFVSTLKKINDDREKLNIKNVEIKAYASPEGGYSFNDKLGRKRQGSTEEYVRQQLRQTNMNADVDARYTAQDWDGFKKLVAASNIQDKDVILRVLSMYNDPEQREEQIRNMSEGFREIVYQIMPELRRSRLIINYETIGRSDEEIKQQYAVNASKLDPEELLYAATLENSNAKKEEIYRKATECYDKDYRAYNNLAAMEMSKGNEMVARNYIDKALRQNLMAPEALANRGLMSLKNGNIEGAQIDIEKASDSGNVAEAKGLLNIAKGDYAQAEANLTDIFSNSALLAQILNRNYSEAETTLKGIKNADGLTFYLATILAVRKGNKTEANYNLAKAIQLDPSLRSYADSDLELAPLK